MRNTTLRGLFVLFIVVTIPFFGDDSKPPLTPAPDDGTITSTYGPFVYDPTGNITAVGSTPGSYYVYDPMSRVVSAGVQRGTAVQTQTYSYDVYGNRLSVGGSGGGTYTVNPSNNRLTSQNAEYDAAGNLIRWYPIGSMTPREYTYDATSMLIHEDTGADLPTVMHIYTANDERYWSLDTIAGPQNVSRYTLRDLNGNVLRRFFENAGGFSSEEYVYRDGLLLASIKTGATHHYSLDHLGTPRIVTDQNRAQLAEHTYYPFGQEITDSSPTDGRLKFTGHERDADPLNTVNGQLDYMHARYYGSAMGRFLSPDPILGNLLQPRSWNRYAYVLNNPTNFVDPFGLAERKPGEKIEEGDTCDGKIVDGWCTGETITVQADAPSIDWVSVSAGFGDGIIATLSFGLVSGHELRKLTGADQVVDRCSQEYLGGRVGGTVVTLAAYAYGAIPATLTHFTTRGGAAAIQASGTVLPSTGLTLFGDGVYATAGSRIFVPAASTVPIAVSGQGFIRIIPNAVFLQGGSAQTAAMFGAYGAAANRDAIGNPECE